MYAVIETGGKQHLVELGTEFEVELLDAEPGQEITLDRVLLIVDGEQRAIGQPVVEDGAVSALVLRQDRGEKTISFKYRPKARRRVKKGHRQELTVLRITDVRLGDKSAAAEAREAEEQSAAERARIEQAAARQAAEDAALAERLAKRARTTEKAAPETEKKSEAKPARRRARAAEPKDEEPKAEAAEPEAEDETPSEGPGTAAETTQATEAPKKRARPKKDE